MPLSQGTGGESVGFVGKVILRRALPSMTR